ncbi:MAG: response regulator [Treponema sp.]|jgi:two-component system response regulator YesN|nr:response regulator [Treponema sp.]
MYKIFIVEDEIVIREGIRNNIPWESTPYVFAGEAPDGEIALSMIGEVKPDILVADIKMPFMDGLTLARIVKKSFPWIKIIIMSGHDEFEFAREAISIGVEEYLLKPVSSSDMLKVFDRVAAKIDKEKENHLNIEQLKRQVKTNEDILKEKWLNELIDGKINTKDALESAREFNIDLIAPSYVTAVARITHQEQHEDQLLEAKLLLNTSLQKYEQFISFPGKNDNINFIIKNETLGPDNEIAFNFFNAIKDEIEKHTDCKIAAVVGPAAERLGEIPRSYRSAESLLRRNLSLGLHQILSSETSESDEGNIDESRFLDLVGDPLTIRLRYAAKKDIESVIQGYADILKDTTEENSLIEYYILGEIIVASSKIVEELGGNIKDIIPFTLNRFEINDILSSREIFYKKIKTLLDAVIDFRDSRQGGKYNTMILKAKDYIDRHYMDEGISLHTVASHVNFSQNHFSTIFSQETGGNFIEYLTKVRIEKAKELLINSNLKSADIAYEVGFSDPHYFSFIFKKNTGISPREFRTSAQNTKK